MHDHKPMPSLCAVKKALMGDMHPESEGPTFIMVKKELLSGDSKAKPPEAEGISSELEQIAKDLTARAQEDTDLADRLRSLANAAAREPDPTAK